jgi:hypothetical protein
MGINKEKRALWRVLDFRLDERAAARPDPDIG